MSDQIDRSKPEIEHVLPNGPEILGAYNDHVVSNFRAGGATAAQLLSTWRMAKLVVGEPAPLTLTRYRNLP